MSLADLINQIGVPAVVVLLLLDRVVAIVKARWGSEHTQASGAKPTEFWEAKIGQIVNEAMSRILVPALERQNTLLEQENAQLGRLNEKMAIMLDRSTHGRGKAKV